jgi:hypothetical protein
VDAPSKTHPEIALRNWLETEVRDGRVRLFANPMKGNGAKLACARSAIITAMAQRNLRRHADE